ncbi:hypothetical protein [Salinisphaera sp. LB1]|uniref:hypothetical protein n=1 Tax=Salinisphaera sp. LB1 TaxID=2183911 RepID=UPI0011AB8293|nr:hypothetical protein [Salinisphaera sp. LB1]
MISTKKNLIFTVTHGRTGTTMLAEVLKLFDHIHSEHEPEPNYASIFPDIKQDPRFAIDFLKKKIKKINESKAKHYAETSNVFGKGFLIPLARMGICPNLIFLNRNFRDTAKSLYVRGSYPARTPMGQHYSSDPSAPGSLPIFDVDSLTNYQLCYWGVLDSYHRQLYAQKICTDLGKQYVWTSPGELQDFDTTMAIGKHLGLTISEPERAREQHKRVTALHHNPNRGGNNEEPEIDYGLEETEVIDRVAFFDPLFIDMVRGCVFFDSRLSGKVS